MPTEIIIRPDTDQENNACVVSEEAEFHLREATLIEEQLSKKAQVALVDRLRWPPVAG